MYGLLQAGSIAHDDLIQNLSSYGYHLIASPSILSWWLTISEQIILGNNTSYILRYICNINKKVTKDWYGKILLRYHSLMSMKNHGPDRHVRICTCSAPFFPGWNSKIEKDSPYPWTPPQYGENNQIINEKNLAIELDTSNQRRFQKIVVKILCYAQAIDSTMLMALNSLSLFQTNPTVETAKEITHFLNCRASHPDAVA